jgi:periplasmic protein TonB
VLETLTLSAPSRQLQAGRPLLAAILHGVVLLAAAYATAARSEPAHARGVELVPFYDLSSHEVAAIAAERGAGVEARIPAGSVARFEVVGSEITAAIPAVSLGPGLPGASVLRPGFWESGRSTGGDSTTAGGILRVEEVDEPAAIIRQPSPRYPSALQHAGLEGRVLLEFVIDTTGHPEPASLRVVERSMAGFDRAALETIQRSLFRPARVRGVPVRQRTLQAIVFRLEPD